MGLHCGESFALAASTKAILGTMMRNENRKTTIRQDLADRQSPKKAEESRCPAGDGCLLTNVLDFINRVLSEKESEPWKTPPTKDRIATLCAIGPDAVEVAERTLANNLRARNDDVCVQAMYVLGKLVSPSTPMLSAVQEALRHGMASIRKDAIGAIKESGSACARFVPQLVAMLEQDRFVHEQYTAHEVIFALGAIGPAAVPAIPILLKYSGGDFRGTVRYAIRDIGPTALDGELLRIDRGKEGSDLRLICEALGEAAVPGLEAALLHPNVQVRDAAIHALGEFRFINYGRDGAERACPALAAILGNESEEPSVRERAAWALSELAESTDDKSIVAAFEATLASSSVVLRRYAIAGLWRMMPLAKSSVPALVRALEDKDAAVRRLASDALGHYACCEPEVGIPMLLAMLTTPLHDVVLDMLVNLRERLVPWLSEFSQRLVGANPIGRSDAAQLLRRLGMPGIAVLCEALRNRSADVRVVAANALKGGFYDNSADRMAFEALIGLEGEEESEVRNAIAEAITARGVRDFPDVIERMQTNASGPAFHGFLARTLIESARKNGSTEFMHRPLCKALSDPRGDVRKLAAEMLIDVIEPRGDVPAVLRDTLRDPEIQIRWLTVRILARFGNRTIPDLIGPLRDDSPDVRRAAAEALGACGPAAANASTLLAQLLGDRGGEVRKAAAEALTRIEPSVSELGQRMAKDLPHMHRKLYVFLLIGCAMIESDTDTLPFRQLAELLEKRFGEIYSANTLRDYRDDIDAFFREYRGMKKRSPKARDKRLAPPREGADLFDDLQGRPFRIFRNGWECWGETLLYFTLLKGALKDLGGVVTGASDQALPLS